MPRDGDPDGFFSKLVAVGGAEPGVMGPSAGTRFERTRGGLRGGTINSAAEAGLACGGTPTSLALGGGAGAGDAVRGREGGGGGGVEDASPAPAYFHRNPSTQINLRNNDSTLPSC